MNLGSVRTPACATATAAVLLQPASLFACAACYGASDSPMAKGMNWGIFALLAVIVSVLALISVFFVHLGRTSARFRQEETVQKPADDLP